jgi:hypothetical protein
VVATVVVGATVVVVGAAAVVVVGATVVGADIEVVGAGGRVVVVGAGVCFTVAGMRRASIRARTAGRALGSSAEVTVPRRWSAPRSVLRVVNDTAST